MISLSLSLSLSLSIYIYIYVYIDIYSFFVKKLRKQTMRSKPPSPALLYRGVGAVGYRKLALQAVGRVFESQP